MGLGTLLLGGKQRNTYVGFVKVNLPLSENITLSSQSTDLPVELGYNISDHIIPLPTKIQTTFQVSDYSLYSKGATKSTAAETYAILKLQHNLRLPIFYINDLDIFPLCHLESIGVPRSSDNGRSLVFDVSLKEIKILLPLGVPFAGSMLGGSAGIIQQCSSLVSL